MNLMKSIASYWFNMSSNVFKNYKDALLGLLALIIVPGFSLLLAIDTFEVAFLSYGFPLFSIAIAGLYDTYGRYEKKAIKNKKLLVRACFNCAAIVFVIVAIITKNEWVAYIGPILLLVCGLGLIFEVINRVNMHF